MKKVVTAIVLVVATSLLAGCVADPYGGYRRRGAVVRRQPDSAWEVVRNDPCRYREYQKFANEHKNPEKRQRFAERLAREGCSDGDRRDYRNDRDRGDYRYDDPNYDPYRR